MREYWIVVGSAAEAYIYARARGETSLTLVDTLAHAQSRAHEGDLRTGGKGAIDDQSGSGRHQPDPQTTTAEKHADIFAKQLTERLKAGLNDNAYTQLVIVAEPAFLGRVREHLDAPLKKALVHTIDKNWTGQDRRAMEKRLAKQLS